VSVLGVNSMDVRAATRPVGPQEGSDSIGVGPCVKLHMGTSNVPIMRAGSGTKTLPEAVGLLQSGQPA
jgi:hypothetical protein